MNVLGPAVSPTVANGIVTQVGVRTAASLSDNNLAYPTWVMATYKIADCTRYIPYPISEA
jgi:hypothetical protein